MNNFCFLLKKRENIDGLPQFEVSDEIIKFLSQSQSIGIGIVSIITQTKNQLQDLINTFTNSNQYQLQESNEFEVSSQQLLLSPQYYGDKRFLLLTLQLDSIQTQNICFAQLCLTYLLSSLVILEIDNDFKDLKKFVEINQLFMSKDTQISQIPIKAQISQKLRQIHPKFLMIKDSSKQGQIQNFQIIFDQITSKMGSNSALLIDQLFRKKIYIETTLKDISFESLRQYYHQQQFHSKMVNLKQKKIGSNRMNYDTMLELILNFCDTYNNKRQSVQTGAILQIQSSQIHKVIGQIKSEYQDQLKFLKQTGQVDGQILFDTEELDLKHRDLYKKIMIQFDDSLKDFTNNKDIIKERKELINRISNDYEILIGQNYDESREFCSELMTSYFENFNSENKDKEELLKNKDFYIKEKGQQFEEIIKSYLDDARGPFKYRTIVDNVPSFLLEQFDNWFEILNSYYNEEINKNKAILLLTTSNLSQLQLKYQDIEQKKFDVENQLQTLFYDLDSQKRLIFKQNQNREVDKISRLKEIQEQGFTRRLSEYKNKYEKQKEKKKQLKENQEEKNIMNRQLLKEIQEKNKESASYKLKCDQLEKALEQMVSKNQKNAQHSVVGMQDELIQLMKQFRENIITAEEQIKKQRESVQLDSSRNSLSNDSSIRKLIDQNEKQIEKLKQKVKELKDKNLNIQDVKDELEKKCVEFEKQIFELNHQNYDNSKPKPGQSIDKMNEDLKFDQFKLLQQYTQENQDFLGVLQQQKQKIEAQSNQIEELLLKYNESSYKIIDLNFQKGIQITLLRESVKLMQNKSNNFTTILHTLQQDTQQEIKEVIRSCGVKI